MFVRIPGDIFKTTILSLIQGSQKTSVNFLLRGNTLYLQTSGVLVDDKKINVTEYDSEDTCEITVNIDQTINLLNKEEMVDISVRGEVMEIRQESFKFSATKLPEERIDSDVFGKKKDVTLYTDELINYIHSTKALDEVSKILAVGMSPVHIHNGTAYLYYSNTVYVNKLNLPNCAISSELIRKLVPVLGRSDNAKYLYDEDAGLMYIDISTSEVVTLTIQRLNHQMVQGIKNIEVNLRDVGRISMVKYKDYMETICKAYKKLLIELSVCEDGIRLFVDNGNTKFDIGSKKGSLVSIKISTAQLLAIVRLFGSSSDVVIQRGDNSLCFAQQNSRKKLIIAGMLY